MFHKELEELQQTTEQLDLCLKSIYHLIDELFNHPAKDYEVTFNKRVYKLTHPFDRQDREENERVRLRLVKAVINHVVTHRIRKIQTPFSHDMYKILYKICQGEDPATHQIAQSDMDTILAGQSEMDKKYGKKRPLDQDAYQVKMQNQKLVKFDDKDTE